MGSTYASLNYHIVFSTKDRAETITNDWKDDLHAYIGGTIRNLNGKMLAIGGVSDHVHILLTLTASHRIADVVREVKKASSMWAHSKHGKDKFGWQDGYAVFSAGAEELPRLYGYIAKQEEHHKKINFRDELLALCRESGIEPDPRYFI